MAKTLLFMAEDITLAQIVRLKALADAVVDEGYDIHFASSGFDRELLGSPEFAHHRLQVVEKSKVDKAVAKCKPIYNTTMLQTYVDDDLRLIDQVKPDLILGDLRLSLPVSARLAQVPHAALINAYWSPQAERRFFPMPDHPMERWLSYPFMFDGYSRVRPWVFSQFSKPINRLCKKYGLPPVGGLQQWLTFGDYTLFPDTPDLVPLREHQPNQVFLGPVHWSPEVTTGPELQRVMEEEDYIYVTLGSSGRADRVKEVIASLQQLPVKVLLATAGRFPAQSAGNVTAVPYVPGDTAAKRARLVTCNGGSTTGYQALSQGTPVLGLASNLDQYLCMERLEAHGAGKCLRAGTFTASQLVSHVNEMLSNDEFQTNAALLADKMQRFDYRTNFQQFISRVLADPTGTGSAAPSQSASGGHSASWLTA